MLAQVAPARAPVHVGDAEIRAMPSAPMTVRVVVKEHAPVRAPIIARVAVRVLVKAHVTPCAPMTAWVGVRVVAGIRAAAVVMTLVPALVTLVVRAVVKVHAQPAVPALVSGPVAPPAATQSSTHR